MKKVLFGLMFAALALSASAAFVGEGVQSGVPQWDKAYPPTNAVVTSDGAPVVAGDGSVVKLDTTASNDVSLNCQGNGC